MGRADSILALVKALWLTGAGSLKVARLAKMVERGDAKAALTIRELIMSWCHKLVSLFNMRVNTIWQEQRNIDDKRSYVIMSNHVSHLDIPLIFLTFAQYQLTMVAKKELFQIPLFGKAMRYSGCCLELDRQSGGRAMETLQNAAKLMVGGSKIWIAPEGSRSRDGRLGKFKRGGFWLAQHSKAIIIPVTIVGSGDVLPADHWLPHLGQEVKVVVGPLIDTQDEQLQDVAQLMQKVRDILASNLKHYGEAQ